jgi:hypothetical protein
MIAGEIRQVIEREGRGNGEGLVSVPGNALDRVDEIGREIELVVPRAAMGRNLRRIRTLVELVETRKGD